MSWKKPVCALLLAFAIIGTLSLLGALGLANVIEENFFGTGYFDHGSYSPTASDRAMTKDGTISYDMRREWDNDKQTFDTAFIIQNGKGTYYDQYVVKVKNAGFGHEYRATKISGDFSGTGRSVTVKTGEATGATIESLILMDGNATFQGRIIDASTGKPADATQMTAVGEFVLRSYLNLTEPIRTPEDWLEFCSEVDLPEELTFIPAENLTTNSTTKAN